MVVFYPDAIGKANSYVFPDWVYLDTNLSSDDPPQTETRMGILRKRRPLAQYGMSWERESGGGKD